MRPADRNKGYGTLALGALVTEARRLGIARFC
ncbi:hypothetical protein [Paenibacillus sp. JCM 10914]|nr:hypothetical protein [Paenibacillus sp. JCM 10914]